MCVGSTFEMKDKTTSASPLSRLLTVYAWRYRWSYLAGAVFLLVTNWLAVSIPGEIGRAIDGLRAGESIGRYAALIAVMGLTIIVVRSLSRILILTRGAISNTKSARISSIVCSGSNPRSTPATSGETSSVARPTTSPGCGRSSVMAVYRSST